ncbi:MAG: aconitase X catalytic domain-containing protein [Armatimonadetes bacterium]|nr:aconitase X catalytic domain-containing protein [Armatimonadota bacterium]
MGSNKKCMELLVAIGECYGAKRMVPITSAHIAGNYSVMRDEGIEWLENFASELTAEGLKVAVFTTKNPEMFDFEEADELRVPEVYREKQMRIDTALRSIGVVLAYTCHHYLAGNLPRYGDHIAWASSGSQTYANSVIGARSNREADHVVLAAAVAGVIPEYGLHLTENRKAEVLVDVSNIDLSKLNDADVKAMGWVIGKKIGTRIPAIVGLPPDLDIERIKGLLYSITVSGAVGLIHMVGITPEAPTVEAVFQGHPPLESVEITEQEVIGAYGEISSASDEKVDLVIFGCPHCTIQEIEKIATLLEGKKVHPETQLWICTSQWCKTLAKRMRLDEKIKAAGGRIVADVGAASGPYAFLKEQGIRTLALNSVRACYYSSGLFGMKTWLGSTEQCIEAAIKGKWEGTRG